MVIRPPMLPAEFARSFCAADPDGRMPAGDLMLGLKQLSPYIGHVDDAAPVSTASAHDPARPDFASMSPEQHEDEVRRIVREAHAEPTRLIHVAFRKLLAWVWKARMLAGRAARYLATRLVAALISCGHAYANRRRRLRAAAELGAFGDRELQDIGVYRSGSDWAVTHGRVDGSADTAGTARPVLIRNPVPAKPAPTSEMSETVKLKRRAA
jgi:uncharacterized protein YjiS (DUF1127 family)